MLCFLPLELLCFSLVLRNHHGQGWLCVYVCVFHVSQDISCVVNKTDDVIESLTRNYLNCTEQMIGKTEEEIHNKEPHPRFSYFTRIIANHHDTIKGDRLPVSRETQERRSPSSS